MVYVSRVSIGEDTWEIRATEKGICGVSICNSFLMGKENTFSRDGAAELQEYLSGCRKAFSVPLDLSGTPFRRLVWNELLTIPYGQSASYSDIARRIGRPEAVRAVAQAIGKNPCLIMVPCHRILGKHGELTGFSAGLSLKQKLLDLEQIPYVL